MLKSAKVVPVLTIDDASHAVPLARALVAGGLHVLEITLRTDAALEAITLVRDHVEGAVIGAGTVLSPADLDRAAAAGASFAVSPGMTPSLIKAPSLPLLAGVATASEVMVGLEAGLSTFKFFPAAAAGGTKLLSAWAGPFPDVRFCPTGGIDAANAADFLALPNVLCVGGAWVAPRALITEGRWESITALARKVWRLA